jgi:spore photoproduct lyase
LIDKLHKLIGEKTGLRLGINKINELSRLVYEISRREKVSFESVLGSAEIEKMLTGNSAGYLSKFAGIKRYLIGKRYPNALKEPGFEAYFSRMKSPGSAVKTYSGEFFPEKIFIEQNAASLPLASRVRKLFAGINCETVKSLKSYRKTGPASPFDPQKRILLVAVEKWDFVKPCPCTRGTNVVNCGYHVINLGFGCPYDCSYCFLQQYSNSPGIVINANIGDYINNIEAYLHKRAGKRVRIGTGEFTDSLALEHITGYSAELVRFFAGQNAVLELKTKSANVKNLIGLEQAGIP